MSGPTQAHIVEVEDLLRSLSTKLATHNTEDTATSGSWSFGNRSVMAACLLLFVLVPGCAAAAVFLMRANDNVLPIVAPESDSPFVAKSDRLPRTQSSRWAAESLGARDAPHFAAVVTIEDPTFPAPLLLRGSLEDGTTTTFTEPAAPIGNDVSASQPQPERDVRRASHQR